jgi:Xaa-Pro aminopeptidase
MKQAQPEDPADLNSRTHSAPDRDRLQMIGEALNQHQLDAVVCTLPSRVLLLSGYFPVVGTSFAVATREQRVLLIVPEDERELAEKGYAEAILTYKPGRVDRIQTAAEAVVEPLHEAAHKFGLQHTRIGFEIAAASEPASYSAMNLFSGSINTILEQAIPHARFQPADALLADLAAVKTPCEVEQIRLSCKIAAASFERGSKRLQAGISEFEAANFVRDGFTSLAPGFGVDRAEGFAWCMSGPNSAEAAAAYARSRARQLTPGDLILLHSNSQANGYWTDITRTYVLGAPDDRKHQLYTAVFAAREAALAVIRPGAYARDVDAAARDTLAHFGFAKEFKHSTGHGVGFSAISANARPRIHPASDEVLKEGMVFNVEPAVYFEGFGGLRHCDMVAVTANGAELLTPFQASLKQLTLAA